MAEPFSEIEKSLTAKASLEERLREYPELKATVEQRVQTGRCGGRYGHGRVRAACLGDGDTGGELF